MHIGDVKEKQPREAEEAKEAGSSLFVEQHLFHSESFFVKEEEIYETQADTFTVLGKLKCKVHRAPPQAHRRFNPLLGEHFT